MDKLSERLEAAANSPYDLRDLQGRAELLREAAQLARRVEEAPEADLKWDWFGETLAQGIIRIDKPTPEERDAVRALLSSQRVRLVREQES